MIDLGLYQMSTPGGLTQCLLYQNHSHMELQNAHCIKRRSGISPAPVPCQLSQVNWNTGVPDQYGPPERPHRTEECMHEGERKYVNDFLGNDYHVNVQSRTINEYVCRIHSYLSLQPLPCAPKFLVRFNMMLHIPVIKEYLCFKNFWPHTGENQAPKEMLS